MNLIHKLRSQFDEAYRIRHGWGLSPIRSNRELRALVAFCQEQLTEDHMQYNPEMKQVFETTVRLYYTQIVHDDWSDFTADPRLHIHEYVRENAGWYWS